MSLQIASNVRQAFKEMADVTRSADYRDAAMRDLVWFFGIDMKTTCRTLNIERDSSTFYTLVARIRMLNSDDTT